MKTRINLATKHVEAKKKTGYQQIIVFIFGLTFLVSIAIIGFNFFLQSQRDQLIQETNQIQQQISQLNDKKSKYLIIQERLSSIQSVLQSRDSMHTRVINLLQSFPPELTFSSLGATRTSITLETASQDLQLLDRVMKTTLPEYAKSAESQVKTVNIRSFSAGLNGQYTVGFDIQY